MREIRRICRGMPFAFSSLIDHWAKPPEIPETGATFLENARIKARWVISRKNIWTMAEDSGLEVDALNGAPGVFSARYSGERSKDEDNCSKLLDELKGTVESKRTARFRCVIVLLIPLKREILAEGVCEGRIGFTPEGRNGFGYDPVFIPSGFSKSFAELTQEQKNSISHRSKALNMLKGKLDEFR